MAVLILGQKKALVCGSGAALADGFSLRRIIKGCQGISFLEEHALYLTDYEL